MLKYGLSMISLGGTIHNLNILTSAFPIIVVSEAGSCIIT